MKYNANWWFKGVNNEWYKYRVEEFNDKSDHPDRVISDTTVLIEANDTAQRFISSKELALFASCFKNGDRLRLVPKPPFDIVKINKTKE